MKNNFNKNQQVKPKQGSFTKGKQSIIKNATTSKDSKQSNHQNKTTTVKKPSASMKVNTNKTVAKIKPNNQVSNVIKPFQSNGSFLLQRYKNAQKSKNFNKLQCSLAHNIINLITAEKKMFKYFVEERRKLFVETSLQQVQVSPSFYKIFEKFENLCNGICNICEPIMINLQNMLVLLHMSKVFNNQNKTRNGFFRSPWKRPSMINMRRKIPKIK